MKTVYVLLIVAATILGIAALGYLVSTTPQPPMPTPIPTPGIAWSLTTPLNDFSIIRSQGPCATIIINPDPWGSKYRDSICDNVDALEVELGAHLGETIKLYENANGQLVKITLVGTGADYETSLWEP